MSNINTLLSSGLLTSLLSGTTTSTTDATDNSDLSALLLGGQSLNGEDNSFNGFPPPPPFDNFGGPLGQYDGLSNMQDSTAMADQIFAKADLNGDGSISKEEFEKMPHPNHRHHNPNVNGLRGFGNNSSLIGSLLSLLQGNS